MRGDQQWIAPEQLYVGKTGRDVGAWLAERGLDGSRIGIIGLEPYPPFYFDGAVPARTLQGMAQALPKAEFVPVYKAFFRRASVKSEEELGLVRYAAAIGEAMSETPASHGQAGRERGRAGGRRHRHLLRHGRLHRRGPAGHGPGICRLGPPAWQYRSQAPRVLRDGDIVLSEIFALTA